MVITVLSLATLSIIGPYHYVLADWQLAHRTLNSSEALDQCWEDHCDDSRTQTAL